MPYVSIQTAMAVTEAQMDGLQREIGELITIIPGKNVDNCMTQISESRNMYMGGGPAKTVFCEIRLFGAAPKESKAELTGKLNALFEKALGAERVYINFLEFSEWGLGGNYSTR